MGYEYFYKFLFNEDKEKFELMENVSNGLILQFKEPLYYDLVIPSVSNILRSLYIFQDNLNGKKINSDEVNCCFPYYSNKRVYFDFKGKFSKKVGEGLNLCFKVVDKYDSFPLQFHLEFNNELFSKENGFYRFREGKKHLVEERTKSYFNLEEFLQFEEFGSFVKPYVKNLDRSSRYKF